MTILLIVAALVMTDRVVKEFRKRAGRLASWRLYALRDELRVAAFEDGRIRENPLFAEFDEALSRTATHIVDVSMWPMLGQMLSSSFRRALAASPHERDARLRTHDADGYFAKLRDAMNAVVGGYLLRRNPLACLALMSWCLFRTSGRNTLQPVVEEIAYDCPEEPRRPTVRHAAA